MAEIRRYPWGRHLRSTTTSHVVLVKRGRVRRDGAGQSFWFRPLSVAISEVPVDDRELPLLVHARTADFQDLTVQATVTYRFEQPAQVASRLDFGIDLGTGRWTGTPLEQVAHVVTELAGGHVMDLMSRANLQAALTAGAAPVVAALTAGLTTDERLATTGIAVLGVRVVAIRADADLERALQTPAREQAQTAADKATNDRRALAVERERTIAENELANRIELATREQQLVAQEGANARRRAEEQAAAALVEARAQVRRSAVLAAAEGARARTIGQAEADAERARLLALADVDPRLLSALALRELAGHLPDVGAVNITPDLLTGALTGLLPGAGTDRS
ncbi:SPFH domain-containing protein [Angustibacter aerolatus]